MSAQRLVAFMAIHRRALRRAFVAGTLWPDTTDERAGASLRSALWRLNRPGRHVLEAGGSHLQLAPEVDVDLWGTTSLARGLLDGSIPGELLDGCDVSLSGDLLPEWYDDWVVIERERFRQLRLHALEALAEGLTLAGRFSDAIQAGLTAVASEPLRESAHRVLIQVYLAEGNSGEALREYRGFRDLVRDELGVSPSTQMMDLVRGFRI
jgi:DNA-binding SARP family transcriptional activator